MQKSHQFGGPQSCSCGRKKKKKHHHQFCISMENSCDMAYFYDFQGFDFTVDNLHLLRLGQLGGVFFFKLNMCSKYFFKIIVHKPHSLFPNS